MSATNNRPVGLLYTGGTFGMVASERGYTPSTDLPERVEREVTGLHGPQMPAVKWIDAQTGPPVNSADIAPAFWYRLARAIRVQAGHCRGFVVIHGTDTLAYTASALSFLLGDLEQPVVVTGARAPLGERGSDAADNLCRAVLAAADPHRPAPIGVLFGNRLLRANRTTKRHGDEDSIFTSPCCEPLARVEKMVQWCAADPRPVSAPALPAPSDDDGAAVKIGLLAIHPGIQADLVRACQSNGLRGLVLEAYPAAIGPGGDPDFVAALSEAHAAGMVLGAVSQARSGSIRFGRYAAGTPLAEAGVVGGGDMTREAALTKLHYLLAGGCPPDEARRLFGEDLRGELTSG